MFKKYNEYLMLGLAALVMVLVTGLSLFPRGIGGDIWDLTYHLLRIESVKEALTYGSYPAAVNPIFFDGYGYGSSLFYPDIFLVIPALMNMCGISLLLSYKLFLLMLTVAGTCTTYFAIKYMCGNRNCALVGSCVLMLSAYYLADISNRAGLSEYIACVFVPVLAAGIYDYFVCEGRKTWLMGVAFVGLVLSHTIMTYIGLLLTVIIFLSMLFFNKGRKTMFEKKRLVRLMVTALLSVLAVSYYIWPMLEQMLSGKFRFEQPWAHIGEYTQTAESFFAPVGVFMYTAQFGVGIPVLFLLASRVLLGKTRKKWADYMVIFGVCLLVAMTDVIPWKMLEGTSLNMIQFTYRFYPYALFAIVAGMMGIFAEKKDAGVITGKVLLFVAVLAVVCGIWQNRTCMNFGTRTPISKEYVYENNHWVGKGEWVPQGISEEIFNGQGARTVRAESGIPLAFGTSGYNAYFFEINEETGREYAAPLLYYKGYEAQILDWEGNVTELEVSRGEDGLVHISLPSEMNGSVEVWYKGTLIQTISNIISALVIVLVPVTAFILYVKECKTNKEKVLDRGAEA